MIWDAKTYVTGPRGFIIQEIPNYIYTIKTSCLFLFLINTKCNYKMRPISEEDNNRTVGVLCRLSAYIGSFTVGGAAYTCR